MVIQNCPEQYWKPCSYEGTVRVDFATGRTYLLWDGKFNAEAFSPDGQSILLSTGSNLYVADLEATNPVQIASNFAKGPEISALWIRPDQIAFLGTRGSEKYVYLVKPDGTGIRAITHYGNEPFELVPVSNTGGVLWLEGRLDPRGFFTGGFYWTDLETTSTYALPHSNGVASPSPSGSQVAFESAPYVQDEYGARYPVSHLMVLDLETLESREIPLPDLGRLSRITNLLWLPDGEHLLVGRNTCPPPSGRTWTCDVYRGAIIDLEGKEVKELPERFGHISYAWHYLPDGKLLYQASPDSIFLCDLDTLTYTVHDIRLKNASVGTLVLWSPASISWLPPGDRLPFGLTPSPTRMLMASRTPGPTQSANYDLLAWQNLYWDALRPIFFDSAFQRDLQEDASILHSDAYIRTYFPRSGIEVFQGMTFIWGVELNSEHFYEIPLEETCSFVQRHYKRYGWPDQPDRNLVLVRLAEALGDPDPGSEYPYCANFDPAQNADLGLLPTVTPTTRPTRTPADPGS